MKILKTLLYSAIAIAALTPIHAYAEGVLTIQSGSFTSKTLTSFDVVKVYSNTLLVNAPVNSNITIPTSGEYLATTTMKTCTTGANTTVASVVHVNGIQIAYTMNKANECGSSVATAYFSANAGDVVSGKCSVAQGISSQCSLALARLR